MKKLLVALAASVLLVVASFAQADPIQDKVLNNYQTGWYPNNYKQKGPLDCPHTCKAWVGGVAEREKSMGADSKVTHVCKFSNKRIEIDPDARRIQPFLYGNQFDEVPVCYATDMTGEPRKSERFYCLCIAGSPCPKPDLVVTTIHKPVWDDTNRRSVIKAVIKNIGSNAAGESYARVIDPSTERSPGVPHNAVAKTPALAAGASATVIFHLPYWVYNPDADLELTADYKRDIDECDEENNIKVYSDRG